MTDRPRKIIVAVTGASGAVYARLLVEELMRQPSVRELALIFSRNGREVARYEGQDRWPDDPRIRVFDNSDMFAPPASGSARYDAMALVPCSMGTAGRVANGISDSLITRAADVMLKERRTLILVPRETPMSTIHLQNLARLSACGAVVAPACPSFYALPGNTEQLCMSVVERVVALMGLDADHYEWGHSR